MFLAVFHLLAPNRLKWRGKRRDQIQESAGNVVDQKEILTFEVLI